MTGISDFTTPAGRGRYFEAYERAMDECPTPDEVLDVGTRHGTTRVYRFGRGDAPPVVMLPGLMATSACLGPLVPPFAARGPVYTVDTLGEAGRSVQSAPFVDLRDRARWLDDVLARLDLTGVHLVGGSTGGWHAFNQAIHAPDRIASLSALDPTAVTVGFSRRVIRYGVVAAILDRDRVWRRFLRWSAGGDVLDRADVRLILAGIRTYRSRVPFQKPFTADELRSVRVPVLALYCGRSVVHDPIAAADRLRHLLPRADVEVLPDLGHDLFLRPDDHVGIAERVLGFIRQAAGQPT